MMVEGAGNLAFTCLLPVHATDDPADFEAAVASVLGNTLAADRILICQDGPLTPALEQAVSRLKLPVARNPGPKGLHHNLNHALSLVRTPWLCRADADDINRPRRFEMQVEFLRAHPETSVLGGAIEEHLPSGARRLKSMPLAHGDIVRRARWRNPINHMTVFLRTAAARQCGGYPAIPYKEDYGLWLRMIAEGHRLANLPDILVEVARGVDFSRRRSGLHNLASEFALYRMKRRRNGSPDIPAAAIHATRAAILACAPAAAAAYAGFLRR